MAEIVKMLALSPTMEEGQLASWMKAEGDVIEEGEIRAEVETDKATMEMESFFDGVVLKILVPAGEAVAVGTPIAIIGEAGEDISDVLSGGADAPAPAAEPEAAAPAASTPAPAPAATPEKTDRIFASPVARKIAADKGIDLSTVQGSGPRGRIVKADVQAASPAPVPSAPVAEPLPLTPPAEGGEVVTLTPMRKAIARRMTESWTTAPLFALTTEVDMGEVVALRATLNAKLKAAEAGVKLSMNDFVLKAVALALKDVPEMNVAWGGDHVVKYDYVHLGVAVAIPGGLITPVVRDADKLTLGAISKSVRDLATRARDKKLKPHEYAGSTFSVSNLGMFGITKFQAVLNPPEAGILAVGAVVDRPVVKDGAIVPGKRMEITLSCDHRSADGAVGARLMQAIVRYLENPILLTV